jgi:hypothetical protein
MDLKDLTLDISQEIRISATAEAVFRSLLRRIAEENAHEDGTPFPLTLEPWPGGRWYRDLGDKKGHLWGFVQVIKPPTLLEISGPLFMSYPAAGHIQFRVKPDGDDMILTLRHRALGLIEDDHRRGVGEGWKHILGLIKQSAEG